MVEPHAGGAASAVAGGFEDGEIGGEEGVEEGAFA